MSTKPLANEVLELLRDRIRSFEALELLSRLLGSAPGLPLREVKDALNVDGDAARDAIRELCDAGVGARDGEWFVRFAPRDAETERAARALVEAYGSSRLDVMRAMSENAMERIRSNAVSTFADAFRLGKRGKDG